MKLKLKLLSSVVIASAAVGFAAPSSPVPVTWLGGTPAPVAVGVSFGVPWPRGAVQKSQAFALTTADGKALPVQTWPLAFWPDGSLKWSGVATVAGPSTTGEFKLTATPSAAATDGAKISIRRSDTTYTIDTGRANFVIPMHGSNLIDAITVDGREIARDGRLVCVLQDGPDGNATDTPSRELFRTRVDKVTLEQSGPVRAVAKIEGMHVGTKGNRVWLPFTVRLYFYAGQESARMVHTFVFDGDESRDFIRGLVVVFSVPMREQVQNRHVRFSGENGGSTSGSLLRSSMNSQNARCWMARRSHSSPTMAYWA